MKKSELDHYRQMLLALRARLKGDMTNLSGDALRGQNGTNSPPADPADLGAESFDQEFTLSLLQTEEQVLGQIEAALKRIDAGTFGDCESCQQAIPKDRLQFIPFSAYCVNCARKLEKRT